MVVAKRWVIIICDHSSLWIATVFNKPLHCTESYLWWAIRYVNAGLNTTYTCVFLDCDNNYYLAGMKRINPIAEDFNTRSWVPKRKFKMPQPALAFKYTTQSLHSESWWLHAESWWLHAEWYRDVIRAATRDTAYSEVSSPLVLRKRSWFCMQSSRLCVQILGRVFERLGIPSRKLTLNLTQL